jgi:hypothetical protein
MREGIRAVLIRRIRTIPSVHHGFFYDRFGVIQKVHAQFHSSGHASTIPVGENNDISTVRFT